MSTPWDIVLSQSGIERFAGQAVGAPSGGTQTVLRAEATLEPADILALTTPFGVLPPPAVDQFYTVVGAFVYYKFGSVPYAFGSDEPDRHLHLMANADSDTETLRYGDVTTFNFTEDAIISFVPISPTGWSPDFNASQVLGKPLTLVAGENPVNDPPDTPPGDGTATVVVYYALETVPS